MYISALRQMGGGEGGRLQFRMALQRQQIKLDPRMRRGLANLVPLAALVT